MALLILTTAVLAAAANAQEVCLADDCLTAKAEDEVEAELDADVSAMLVQLLQKKVRAPSLTSLARESASSGSDEKATPPPLLAMQAQSQMSSKYEPAIADPCAGCDNATEDQVDLVLGAVGALSMGLAPPIMPTASNSIVVNQNASIQNSVNSMLAMLRTRALTSLYGSIGVKQDAYATIMGTMCAAATNVRAYGDYALYLFATRLCLEQRGSNKCYKDHFVKAGLTHKQAAQLLLVIDADADQLVSLPETIALIGAARGLYMGLPGSARPLGALGDTLANLDAHNISSYIFPTADLIGAITAEFPPVNATL